MGGTVIYNRKNKERDAVLQGADGESGERYGDLSNEREGGGVGRAISYITIDDKQERFEL